MTRQGIRSLALVIPNYYLVTKKIYTKFNGKNHHDSVIWAEVLERKMHQSIPSGPDVTEHIQTQTHTQVSDLGLMVGSLQSASLVSGIWYSE